LGLAARDAGIILDGRLTSPTENQQQALQGSFDQYKPLPRTLSFDIELSVVEANGEKVLCS